nr:MAG TPA: hypothetical protein [Caudoviricetes sp.]DAY77257.1 MAG TPA: hypothetical protein [Caudoviricetes sp.]
MYGAKIRGNNGRDGANETKKDFHCLSPDIGINYQAKINRRIL